MKMNIFKDFEGFFTEFGGSDRLEEGSFKPNKGDIRSKRDFGMI